MSKLDILHYSIGDLRRTLPWFTFLGSWIQRICSSKPWVGFSTIGVHPCGSLWQSLPVFCLGSTSSLYLRQDSVFDFYWIFFDDFTLYFRIFFFAGHFFPAWMCSAVSHHGRVWVGELCDLQSGLMHVSSRMAIYGWSTVVDDATALRWSYEDCSTRVHSFYTSCCT